MSSSKTIKANKSTVIQKHQIHNSDTGSPEVQISLLTKEIENLTNHLIDNPKDVHSRRGLLRKVGQRRKILRYLKTKAPARYKKTVSANNLRG